jgi:integrase
MSSIWLETRKTNKGDRHRIVWREPTFDADGRPLQGPRRVGRLVSNLDTAVEQRLAKLNELERIASGLKPKMLPRSWRTVSVLYLDHSIKHKSPKTYRHFDKPAVDSFTAWLGARADLPVQSIGVEEIQGWETALLVHQKPAGASARLRCVRAALHYARKAGWLDKVPPFTLPRIDEEVGRVLPPNELQSLLEAASGDLRRGLTILLYTGMRLGELFSLKWEDIRNNEATIRTLKRKQREGQRMRVIPLHGEVLAALGPAGIGPVIGVTRNSFESAYRKTIKRFGWPRTRIHDLRHTWATRLMETTGDLYALMRYGGWKDLQSVERYQHLTKGRSTAILGLDFGFNNTGEPHKTGHL